MGRFFNSTPYKGEEAQRVIFPHIGIRISSPDKEDVMRAITATAWAVKLNDLPDAMDFFEGATYYKGTPEKLLHIELHDASLAQVSLLWDAILAETLSVSCARIYITTHAGYVEDFCSKELFNDDEDEPTSNVLSFPPSKVPAPHGDPLFNAAFRKGA